MRVLVNGVIPLFLSTCKKSEQHLEMGEYKQKKEVSECAIGISLN